MGYRNAKAILPPQLLRTLQQYAEGECLYIPYQEAHTRPRACAALAQRNEEIWQRYRSGVSVQQLAESYYLSPQAIYKILSKFR